MTFVGCVFECISFRCGVWFVDMFEECLIVSRLLSFKAWTNSTIVFVSFLVLEAYSL